jgi:hypothetical protein
MPPIENSTSAGTPLATQNAPVQSIFRCRLGAAPSALTVPFAAVAVLMATPKGFKMTTLPPHNHAACPERSGTDDDRAALRVWPKVVSPTRSPLFFWALEA